MKLGKKGMWISNGIFFKIKVLQIKFLWRSWCVNILNKSKTTCFRRKCYFLNKSYIWELYSKDVFIKAIKRSLNFIKTIRVIHLHKFLLLL